MKKELKFFLTVSEKIISVNSLYLAGMKYINGKPKPYIYRNPKADKIEHEILEQLRAVDFSEYIDWIKNTKQFTLTISFILKTNVTKRDVENLPKQISDTITKFIKNDLGIDKFDDSLFTSVHFYKSVIPKAKKEYCCVQLAESKDNLRFDIVDEPKRFFLGGTCAGSTWRDEIIPILKERKKEYFNPVVEDWTEECIEIENIEKTEKCDTHLYILTPQMSGVYSVAEIIDSIWSCITKGYGFVYFGILGTESDWGESMWKSLKAVMKMVKEIASTNSRIKAGFIKEAKEILDF